MAGPPSHCSLMFRLELSQACFTYGLRQYHEKSFIVVFKLSSFPYATNIMECSTCDVFAFVRKKGVEDGEIHIGFFSDFL